MEPPLGQISFFLLCMQYARSQLENLGAKPYTAAYKAKRAKRLCKVSTVALKFSIEWMVINPYFDHIVTSLMSLST